MQIMMIRNDNLGQSLIDTQYLPTYLL
jgi:hypothetical protein